MSDSPGWAPPGSPPPEDGPEGRSPADPSAPQQQPQPTPPPQAQQPQGWGQQPQGWGQAPQGWGQPTQGWGQQAPQQWASPGWQRAAFAAKPGVIPLRPLGVGEILDGAVSTARSYWRTVLTVALAIAVLTQLVSSVGLALWTDDSPLLLDTDDSYTDEQLNDALGDLVVWGGTTALVSLLGSVLATAMLTMVVSRAVLGRPVTVGEAWRDSRPRLLRLLGLVLLIPLIACGVLIVPVAVGIATGNAPVTVLLLIGGVVVGIWLWIQFSLAAPVLMLERQGVTAALRRSWKLVSGSWWRVFGIQLLMMLILAVVSGIVEFPVSAIATLVTGQDVGNVLDGTADLTWGYLLVSGIGAVISATVTLPISAGVTALLYIDQRIRREALDIELARAAGVPQSPGT
ncbi:DUF7544 domain-containing protein [Streptomyces avicenniae]|uniref:DUF7544 domain-containing protein n=1 Tax=Streptomyces avicenniae TaxID=500153 RepID=UPI00069C8EF6|nr:hypothetical protein [Streptomyces avicenniae]